MAIDTSYLLSTYQTAQREVKGDNLGKDDFLKLLMTQLQNQDPTSPMDDTQFISQMATFSSLEQVSNISTTLDKFVSLQQQNSLISYNQFVGKEVTWHNIIESEGSEPIIQEGTGVISSIQFKGDSVNFILEDGTSLEPGNISEVKQTSSTGSLMSASELIGKLISYLNDQNEETSAIVKAVQMKDGKAQLILEDGSDTKITSNQITKIAKA
ncbi:flagellar hook assembly protein FlgD [Peribacillus psychrosaccharolyticus]|nr:flagellar hook assembly protein FlgD [Peribacillus psychrosaccharolyticus]MEC2053808.1 flagellar hook assembly protein FlgD [Peribacillus psychrosaccharolyticus]MED3742578.1 flagellar hook assembly protein FlgD [Peribacillus psychrosaccharolyticus]